MWRHHPQRNDIEAILTAAKRSKLDIAYDQFLAARSATAEENADTSGQLIVRLGIGQVLGVR